MTTVFVKDGFAYADSKVTRARQRTLNDVDRDVRVTKIYLARPGKFLINDAPIVAFTFAGTVNVAEAIVKSLENGSPDPTVLGVEINQAIRNMWPLLDANLSKCTLGFLTNHPKHGIVTFEMNTNGMVRQVNDELASFGSGKDTIRSWAHFIGWKNLTAKELIQLTAHLDQYSGGEYKCLNIKTGKFVPVEPMTTQEKAAFRKKVALLVGPVKDFFDTGVPGDVLSS